jgi:hypothetical protein
MPANFPVWPPTVGDAMLSALEKVVDAVLVLLAYGCVGWEAWAMQVWQVV